MSADAMTVAERNASLIGGHSIQGCKVFDQHGGLWGAFENHDAAVAAVNAYRAGFDAGRKLGAREGAANVRDAICGALGLV